MARKLTRKGIVRKLDKLVTDILLTRDKACVLCGSTTQLGTSHLFSRKAFSTRWDLQNCNLMCWKHNFAHTYDTYPYTQWFVINYGRGVWEDLHLRFVTPRKFKTFELIELYEALKPKP